MVKSKLSAFTLAEVLITLGIIGIVAALTIPSLMNNIQDSQFKQAWKKNYSVISQAYQRYVTENGGSATGLCAYSAVCVRDVLQPYLNIAKLCSSSASEGCWSPAGTLRNYTGTTAAGMPTNGGNTTFSNPGLVLNDGTFMLFESSYDSTCPVSVWSGNLRTCGYVIVDVNGIKPPNQVGKDVYLLFFTDVNTVPAGNIGSPYPFGSSGSYGWGYSASNLLN